MRVDDSFLKNLLKTLKEFHQFQLDHSENGVVPYSYDTLGLAEWLEFDKEVNVEESHQ